MHGREGIFSIEGLVRRGDRQAEVSLSKTTGAKPVETSSNREVNFRGSSFKRKPLTRKSG